MKKIIGRFFKKCSGKKTFFLTLTILFAIKMQAQVCDPPPVPVLFGQSVTSIFCKSNPIGFGVNNSDPAQVYYFAIYKKGGTTKKAGPLDGNGQQLSITCSMQSAQDAGEYRITTFNDCGDSNYVNFYAFYGGIDNLSITAWGSNAVSFHWAASGPSPTVTYEYAVTTEADPELATADYVTTTDTVGSKTGLTSGVTYYIYVHVSKVVLNGEEVVPDPNFSDCGSGPLPWQALRFVSCPGSSAIASITPAQTSVCLGGTATFTATGGSSYQWYSENNVQIPGANTASYTASLPGQYKVFTTTGAGCQGITASATLTQVSLQAGVFSGGKCYNMGDSVRLGISKTLVGQTYKILRDGAEVASLQGIGTAEFSFSEDTVWYKFKLTSATQYGHYTVRTSNPYCTPLDFGNQTVSGYGRWSGVVSSDWQNTGNWDCGAVPDANTAIIIPGNAANMPVVNGNISCKSIDVQQGATLTVATGFKLNITGP